MYLDEILHLQSAKYQSLHIGDSKQVYHYAYGYAKQMTIYICKTPLILCLDIFYYMFGDDGGIAQLTLIDIQ